MVWLLTNVFGYSEGSALIRAPYCWIILFGCTAIAILLFADSEISRNPIPRSTEKSTKNQRTQSRDERNVRNEEKNSRHV